MECSDQFPLEIYIIRVSSIRNPCSFSGLCSRDVDIRLDDLGGKQSLQASRHTSETAESEEM